MVTKQAQMKIQQTAFLLMALTLFFVLAGLFFLSVELSGNKDAANMLREQEAKQLVSKLASSPEFSCGDAYESGEADCVDFDKVFLLAQQSDVFRDLWGVRDIKVRVVYPSFVQDVACTSATYPNCSVLHLFDEETVGSYYGHYVTLCRKEVVQGRSGDVCSLGLILASYETAL